MTQNLETADHIAKLLLAGATLILFFTGVIAGPFANLLAILSGIIVAIFMVKLVLKRLATRKR